MDDEIARLEQAFWTQGAAHYRAFLDPACVMAFPAPTGILSGTQAITATLEGAPRWRAVTMHERRLARVGSDLAVHAYRAEAVREGGPPYVAYCTSTYRRDGQRWRLVQHQQTPV